jgi:peptidoglycan hydrolase CwlO-like protein
LSQNLIDFFIMQGPYAVLFVLLLVHTQKQATKREERLMEHLEKTSQTLSAIHFNLMELEAKLMDQDAKLDEIWEEIQNVKEEE